MGQSKGGRVVQDQVLDYLVFNLNCASILDKNDPHFFPSSDCFNTIFFFFVACDLSSGAIV